jgi:CRISPR-associated protein (TIGR02710 family)
MIFGVGVGKFVEYAIYASLKANNPNFVLFITTEKSSTTLERPIAEEDGKSIRDIVPDYEEIVIQHHEDLNLTFNECRKALSLTFNKGFSSGEIVTDITSGTKIMSAALAILSIINRLYAITYVGGVRDDTGVVLKGSEKPHSIKPISVLLHQDLRRVEDFMAAFQFGAADKIIDGLVEGLAGLADNERSIIEDVKSVLQGYLAWERFDHKKALRNFQLVKNLPFSSQIQFLETLKADHNDLANKHIQLRGKVPSKYFIIDIFQNAERRAQEGNYDDAVGRLYRCLEMIGQYALLTRFKIDSSNINLSELKERLSDSLYERLSSRIIDDNVKTGLVENLEIISSLDPGDIISQTYVKEKDELKKCLAYRNNSILAHGVSPVDKENYERMKKLITEFIRILFPDWTVLINQLETCFAFSVPIV